MSTTHTALSGMPAEVGGSAYFAIDDVRPETLPSLFEAQVRRTPDNLAFIFGDDRYSYSELDIAANRVARLLLARGIGPESIVGLLLPRSPQLLIALLGIVKAGAAYLPMDPDYPSARLISMLKDSGVAQVLTTSDLCKQLQLSTLAPCMLLDVPDIRQELASMSADRVIDADRLKPLQPDNLLYVIYTSGSTGLPKAVAVEHRSFTSLMKSLITLMPVGADETCLALTTICFDPAGMEIFLPLLQGASLKMLGGANSRDPIQVVEAIRQSRISTVAATATFWRALLACDVPRTVRVVTGGEALSSELVPQLLEFREAINQYGPTETTVCSSLHRIEPEDATRGPVVTIGRPLDRQKFYILDEHLEQVPLGCQGELYIGGAGLARGYLNRPELTAERFIHCPFGAPGERMYRTGDLAAWREDGNVQFLGRADQQVKIRGYRIEPGEIEAAILQLVPAIKECVVSAREVRGQVHLVAYHVNIPGARVPDRAEIRARLSGLLPDHMVPGIFSRLDAIPCAPNGKIDRAALPLPEVNSGRVFQPPVGAVETVICKIFRDLTGASRVGRDDDFFQIGGHSLAAVLCVHRLRREFARDVTLRQLFDAPTAQSLAASLSNEAARNTVSTTVRSPQQPAIFLIPGMGGDEPRLVRLRMEWKGGGNVIALDYPQWPQLLERDGSMDDLLRYFLRQIEELAPEGPVWLLGYSLGGNCAHALAAYLQAAGRPVAFLGLLDAQAAPSLSGILSAQLQDGLSLWQGLWEFEQDIGRLLKAVPQKQFTRTAALTLVRRLTTPWVRPLLALVARYHSLRLPVTFGYHFHAYLNEARRVALVNSWCRKIEQAPVPFLVPAFLFRSETHLADAPADLGWSRHLPLLRIVDLPGTHATMLDPPHLKTLCERACSVVAQLLTSAETVAAAQPFHREAEVTVPILS